MAWTFDRELVVAAAGTAATSRTYTTTNASGVPVGAVLVAAGGCVTNIPTGFSSTPTNAGAVSAWVPLYAGDAGTGIYVLLAYAAVVLGTLTNTDTVTITFSAATAPVFVVRSFTSSAGAATAVALDKVQAGANSGVAAGGSWSSGATATSTNADPLQFGITDHDNGAGTSGIASTTLTWNSTTTTVQGPIGSMLTSARWRSPGANTGIAFAGTSSVASTDFTSVAIAINATVSGGAAAGPTARTFNPIPFMGGGL